MPANIASTLQEGLLADYRGAYAKTRRTLDARVALLMDMNWQTNGRSSTRGYIEAAPHVRYQPYGDPIEEEGMGSRSFQVVNYPYSLRIKCSQDDIEDDRTNSYREMAAAGGASHALSPERSLFDMLNGTTSFLPGTVLAADGLSVFSSSTRFEVSGGNSLSSFSVADGAAFRAGLWRAEEYFRSVKDGKGQPLFTDDVLDGPRVAIYSSADEDVASEAFYANTVAYAASTATSNAAIENPLIAAGKRYIPWCTSRIATGTLIVALANVPVKPFGQQVRGPIKESFGTNETSDESRTYATEYVQWRQRLGFGAGLPLGLVKLAA